MWSRQLSTFAGSFSFQRGASVVSVMRERFAVIPRSLPPISQFSTSAGPARSLLARELDDPVVEPLRCDVHRLLELGGDQAVSAAEEGLTGPVELLAKAIRRLLADRAHPVLELDRARFTACVDLTRGRPLEMLHLSPLELGESELDPGARLALGAVDLLRDGVLVLAKALVQLVDGASTVVGLRGQLLESARERVACARLELLAEADRGCALLVDRGVELVGLGSDLRLDVGDALAHPLLQRRHGSLKRVLRALEIGLPRPQALLDALLDGRDELRHALGQLALADGELAAPLVRETALLGDVGGERVGLCACDRDAELLRLCRRLFLRGGANRPASFGDELLRANGRARARRSESASTTESSNATTSAAISAQARFVTSGL